MEEKDSNIIYIDILDDKKKDSYVLTDRGLTPFERQLIIDTQKGLCKACGDPLEIKNGRVICHMDHNHELGWYRGAVHPKCNRLFAKNTPRILLSPRAIEYYDYGHLTCPVKKMGRAKKDFKQAYQEQTGGRTGDASEKKLALRGNFTLSSLID